jgi:hypothetical protein
MNASLILLHQSCTVKIVGEISPQLLHKKITMFCSWGARATLVLRDMKAKDKRERERLNIFRRCLSVSAKQSFKPVQGNLYGAGFN